MNENKTELILKIARELSDESCAMILARISQQRNKTMLSNEENWDETKHPRHDDGRFAPGGFGRASMTKKEA